MVKAMLTMKVCFLSRLTRKALLSWVSLLGEKRMQRSCWMARG